MNKLTTERRAAVLTALVEGNSIASTCRMFGVNKITVLRLLADAGTLAADYHDLTVRCLSTKRVQMDEIWSFVGAKQRNVQQHNWGKGQGDTWVWVSIDADSKLAINWMIGGRDATTGTAFVKDLAERLDNRVQLSSDGLPAYISCVQAAFGDEVDYAQLMKEYATVRYDHARYSPPICIAARPQPVCGNPSPEHINTSFVERQNLTMRMSMRRFTRLTNAFSKIAQNHRHAVALHYFHYNFIRRHQTTKTTPAVAAGIADKEWTMLDFVKMLENEELIHKGRMTDYKPSACKRKDDWPTIENS